MLEIKYLAVLVLVELFDNDGVHLRRDGGAQHALQFVQTESSVAILIQHSKGRLQLRLGQRRFDVHRRRQKLYIMQSVQL